ncbi:MAG: hypothetical protein K8J31_04235 [Anaerolineae bacterium]|nr:hypothetical protein [Anaerolineae bacterium]
MKILVGYATEYGSTAEIAEFIGHELEHRDFQIDVRNVKDIQSVKGYDAFVLGSAIHAGMWLSEMSQFLDRFQKDLKGVPIAFFITCIRVLEGGGYDHCLREYVNHRVLDLLNVKALTAFAGRLELDAVDWEDRWTLAARYDGKEPPGMYNSDFRDWDKIQTWARKVADTLLPA